MARVEAGKAFMELLLEDRDFAAALARVGDKLRNTGRSISSLGAGVSGVGLAIGAGFVPAIQAASDLQETMNKFDVVFADRRQEVKQWSDGFAEAIGRSKKQVANFLASSQDLLVPIGFEADAAEKMSKEITALTVDLASFNNKADGDVLNDLQAALTGSGEVMKKYGVIVNETAVKNTLLNEGIDPKKATEQQKTFARWQIILAGTTAAQGDAVRSADSFANQYKALQARAEDLLAAIGTPLLDAVAGFVGGIATAVGFVEKFARANPQLIQTVALVAVGLVAGGAALIAFGGALSVAGFAVTGILGTISAFGAAFAAVVSPIGLAIAAIVGAGAAFFAYTKAGQQAVDFLVGQFGKLFDFLSTVMDAMTRALAEGDLELAARVLWSSLELAWLTGTQRIREIWINATAGFQEGWAEALAIMQSAWVVFSNSIADIWNGASNLVAEGILRLQGLFDSSFDVEGAIAQLDAAAERAREERSQRQTEDLLAIDQSRRDAIAGIRAGNREALTSAEERLAEATAEWQSAIAQAQDLPAATLGDVLDRAAFDIPSFESTLAGAGRALQSTESARGTFTGAAAAQIFGDTKVEEKQLEELKEIKDAAQQTAAAIATLGVPTFG